MIVNPTMFNEWEIEAETEAEMFLMESFLNSWKEGSAKISMDIYSDCGKCRLEITNQVPKELPSERLVSRIKKQLGL